MLLGEVFTNKNYGCRIKDEVTLTKLRIFLSGASADQVADKLLFRFYNQQGNDIESLLTASKRTDAEGRVTGVLCFLHVASPELQNPLNGVKYIQNLMSSSNLTQDQTLIAEEREEKEFLLKYKSKVSTFDVPLLPQFTRKYKYNSFPSTISKCSSYKELGSTEFNLKDVLDVVVNQVMILSREREVQITCDAPAEVASMYLYGDNARLQQVLS
ncbi:hypothetical protein AgCh_024686 [Apium graveolens]